MSKYVNALIKSKKEFYRRLLDGEIFYMLREGATIKVMYEDGFRIEGFGVVYSLTLLAEKYAELCIARQLHWYEYPLPKEGLLVYRSFSPKLIIHIQEGIATTDMGDKFNVYDLAPITTDDPRLFRADSIECIEGWYGKFGKIKTDNIIKDL